MQHTAVRAHPERTAWVVVLIAFAIFCLLVVCVPLGARHLLLYSTKGHPATLRTLEGTVVVDNPATGNEYSVTKDQTRTLGEGTVISLDDNSRAVLDFFDGSSLHLLPGSRVSIERMQGRRFGLGLSPNTIWLRIVSGRVKVVTSGTPDAPGLDFRLRCLLLDTELAITTDGVYGVEVEPDGAEVFANRGSAVVSANGKSVQLVASERATIEAGHQPIGPLFDAREMVDNADFDDGLAGWEVYNDQGNDGGDVPGMAVQVVDGGLPAVRFFRTGSNRNHCETVLSQTIGRELPDPVSSLEVRASFKLANQSLSGGGVLGSEYPLMIRLLYRDVYGSENTWVQGFYYENPLGNPVASSAKWYPRGSWELFESGNLLETLDPKPFEIISIQVYASGWDYESMIRWISVAVK